MSHGGSGRRTVSVAGLSRVEGSGSLTVEVLDGLVTDVALSIFEPPRFFEALLQGRDAREAPDLTARVCGICPVAYQTSAANAVEAALGLTVDDRITRLRRLLYCGEWLQSHALHVAVLHAPDFLGCADAVELAERDPEAVHRGLRLRQLGNLVIETVGGRAVHPVNFKVGGFFRAPAPAEIAALAEPLRAGLDDALDTVAWVAGFTFPEADHPYRFVALHHPERYAIESGQVRSSQGLDVPPDQFADLLVEEQVAHSTALQARLDGRPYLTGPLARYALNGAQLGAQARQAAQAAGLGAQCTNPFKSIVVRAVEMVFACEEALGLVAAYEPPAPPAASFEVRAGTGTGVSEAPRGILLHRYQLDPTGTIVSARLVPPTSQNQLVIEDDLRRIAQDALFLDDPTFTTRCEQAVRNHDPCISCAAHFLHVTREAR